MNLFFLAHPFAKGMQEYKKSHFFDHLIYPRPILK